MRAASPSPGRRSRGAGVALLTVAALLGAVVVASFWYEAAYTGQRVHCRIYGDKVEMMVATSGTVPNPLRVELWTLVSSEPAYWQWWHVKWTKIEGPLKVLHTTYYLLLPLWPFALVAALTGWWLWRRGSIQRRAAMQNLCRHCGYSLAGLVGGAACPECGRPAVVTE